MVVNVSRRLMRADSEAGQQARTTGWSVGSHCRPPFGTEQSDLPSNTPTDAKWVWLAKRISTPGQVSQSWVKPGSRSRYSRVGIDSSNNGSVSMPAALISRSAWRATDTRSEEHTSELQSRGH